MKKRKRTDRLLFMKYLLLLFCAVVSLYGLQPTIANGETGNAANSVTGLIHPARDNPLRKAILDGLRKDILKRHQIETIFMVKELNAINGWAWVHVLPQSPDGKNNYEDVHALLEQTKDGWVVACYPQVRMVDDEIEFYWFQAVQECRMKHPQAPAAIFPYADWKYFWDPVSGVKFRYPPDWDIDVETGIAVSAGSTAAEIQNKDKTIRVTLFQPNKNDDTASNSWIRINPTRVTDMMQSEGTCVCVNGNNLCTYSNDEEIIDILYRIAESFFSGFLEQSACQ